MVKEIPLSLCQNNYKHYKPLKFLEMVSEESADYNEEEIEEIIQETLKRLDPNVKHRGENRKEYREKEGGRVSSPRDHFIRDMTKEEQEELVGRLDEKIFKCETAFPGRYGQQPNMPAYPYTFAALAFAEVISRGTFGRMANFCAWDVQLSLFDQENKRISGIREFIAYFSQWMQAATLEFPATIKVDWCVNIGLPAVFIKTKGEEMILFFFMEAGRVKYVLFGENDITYGSDGCHCPDPYLVFNPSSDFYEYSIQIPDDFLRAVHALKAIEKTKNEFALSAYEIQKYVRSRNDKGKNITEEVFFSMADGIRLKEGYHLKLQDRLSAKDRMAEWFRMPLADPVDGAFCLFSKVGRTKIDESRFVVTPGKMGAWHLYLMRRLDALVKLSYVRDTIILSASDVSNEYIGNSDVFPFLAANGLLEPSVLLAADGKSADVYCCFSHRIYVDRGTENLYREHVRILFHDDGTASCEYISKFELLQEACLGRYWSRKRCCYISC